MNGRPAAVQPRSLTMDERRVRATRPDLWPAFQPPPAIDYELDDDPELEHDEP